jgi:hypothetical protein
MEAQMHQRLAVALRRSGQPEAAASAEEEAYRIYPAIARARAQSKAWATTPTLSAAGGSAGSSNAANAVVCLAPEDLSVLLSPRSVEPAPAESISPAPARSLTRAEGVQEGVQEDVQSSFGSTIPGTVGADTQLHRPSTSSRMQLPPIQRTAA